jgi:hypothetical protein
VSGGISPVDGIQYNDISNTCFGFNQLFKVPRLKVGNARHVYNEHLFTRRQYNQGLVGQVLFYDALRNLATVGKAPQTKVPVYKDTTQFIIDGTQRKNPKAL